LWYLKNESLVPAAVSFADAYNAIRSQDSAGNADVYKKTDRRIVFQFASDRNGKTITFVAKVFLLNNLRHRLKSYRYGLDETANLLTAYQQGIPVPQIYGYGIRYGVFGIPKANYLIIEYLSGLKTIRELFEEAQGDMSECRSILMRTVPLFESLYNAGCNHIDINCDAILMSPAGSSEAIRLLDLHYAAFHAQSNVEVLAFEAGYFAHCCSGWVDEGVLEEWFSVILNRIRYSGCPRDSIMEKFRQYQKVVLSRKERKRIT